MISLVIAIITALISWILGIAMGMSTKCAMALISPDLLYVKSGTNVLDILENVFGTNGIFLGETMNPTTHTVQTKPLLDATQVTGVIFGIALAIAILLFLAEVINSYFGGLQGEKTQNPIKCIVRFAVTIVMMVIIFGTPGATLFGYNGLIYSFGELMGEVLSPISVLIENTKVNNWNAFASFDIVPAIVLLIIAIALVKGVIEAGIIMIERWLSFAMSILFGPIAVAMSASPQTSDTTKTWAIGLIGQFITIVISMILFYMFLTILNNLSGTTGDLSLFEIFQ